LNLFIGGFKNNSILNASVYEHDYSLHINPQCPPSNVAMCGEVWDKTAWKS
jgi:hypothetical protein